MRLLLILVLCQSLTWQSVRHRLAQAESSNGKEKIHVNADRTIDCGLYQINSRHFVEKDNVGKAFDTIFAKYKVGPSLHERVAHVILNDKLNEELAKKLFELRGIKSWTSHR